MRTNDCRWLLTCLLGAGVGLAAGACRGDAAQGDKTKPIPIKVDSGKSLLVEGKLVKEDRTDGQGNPIKVYSFEGEAGHVYRFLLTTKDFDPALRVDDTAGNQLKNEDTGGGNSSRLTFRPAKNGTFHLVVVSYDKNRGSYRIEATAAAAKDPKTAALKLEKGKAVLLEGQLTATDGTDLQGKFVRLYTFSAAPGKLYRFAVTAKGFYPSLLLEDAKGKHVAYAGVSTPNSATLVFRTDKYADYQVVVGGGRVGDTGSFSLNALLTEARDPKPAAVQFEAIKQSRVSDTLGEEDGIDAEGKYIKAYTFKAEPGKAYRFELTGAQFQPKLQLLDENDRLLKQVMGGFGGGQPTRLNYRGSAAGGFRLLVTSGQAGATGSYTLTITEAAAKEAKSTTLELQAGKPTTVQAALNDEDETDAQSKPYKEYAFTVEAGKTYRVEMLGKNFDPFLVLKDAAGKQLRQHDYTGEIHTSRVVYRFEKAGAYRITASTTDVGRAGDFTLTIAEGGPLDLMQLRSERLFQLTAAEKTELVQELAKHMQAHQADLGPREMHLANRITSDLMYRPGEEKVSQQAHALLGKELAGAKRADVARQGRRLQGVGKRLGLVGQAMDFKGQTVDGKDFDLAKLKGKVVLVEFWASWQAQSVADLNHAKQLYDRYGKDGFEVVGVSRDDSLNQLKDFLQARQWTWPMIYERSDDDAKLTEAYGAFSLPVAILVGADGRVVSITARGDELERLLRKLLEEKK
jgi:peroxiredoxin